VAELFGEKALIMQAKAANPDANPGQVTRVVKKLLPDIGKYRVSSFLNRVRQALRQNTPLNDVLMIGGRDLNQKLGQGIVLGMDPSRKKFFPIGLVVDNQRVDNKFTPGHIYTMKGEMWEKREDYPVTSFRPNLTTVQEKKVLNDKQVYEYIVKNLMLPNAEFSQALEFKGLPNRTPFAFKGQITFVDSQDYWDFEDKQFKTYESAVVLKDPQKGNRKGMAFQLSVDPLVKPEACRIRVNIKPGRYGHPWLQIFNVDERHGIEVSKDPLGEIKARLTTDPPMECLFVVQFNSTAKYPIPREAMNKEGELTQYYEFDLIALIATPFGTEVIDEVIDAEPATLEEPVFEPRTEWQEIVEMNQESMGWTAVYAQFTDAENNLFEGLDVIPTEAEFTAFCEAHK
jgi:hypothetical protein